MNIIVNAPAPTEAGTTEAQESAQNAALGNATAENPAVARTDPTVDVQTKSVSAEDVTGTANVQGGVVTATEAGEPGNQTKVYGDGTLLGPTYQVDPEMFEGLEVANPSVTNPPLTKLTSICTVWNVGETYSFGMIVLVANAESDLVLYISLDVTPHVATLDDAPGTGASWESHWAAVGTIITPTKVTKLDGIEAGADVTDAVNVAAAGAVMNGRDISETNPAAGIQNKHVTKASTGPLTAAECTNTVISNYGQGAEMTLTLPTAAAGLSFLLMIITTGNALHAKAGTNDKIYLDGTALDDADKVSLASPAAADCAAFWTWVTGDGTYDWYVNTIKGVWKDGGA